VLGYSLPQGSKLIDVTLCICVVYRAGDVYKGVERKTRMRKESN
jgi:hypothetical protein